MRIGTVLLAVVLSGVFVVSAQEDRASISGQVTDPSGSSVPGAIITVVSVERQTSSSVNTSDTGRYQVAFLVPGRYVLTVEAPGFKKYVRENILLAVAEKLGLDLKLEVGAVTESVTVRGDASLIETESASRGQVITEKEMHELPNQGRSPFQLVWALSGVTRRATVGGP